MTELHYCLYTKKLNRWFYDYPKCYMYYALSCFCFTYLTKILLRPMKQGKHAQGSQMDLMPSSLPFDNDCKIVSYTKYLNLRTCCLRFVWKITFIKQERSCRSWVLYKLWSLVTTQWHFIVLQTKHLSS